MFTRRDADRVKQATELRDLKMAAAWDYGGSLEEQKPGMIRDTKTLYMPKNFLFEAMLYAIANAKTKLEANLLEHAAITLSEYQDGVGEEPMSPLDTAPRRILPFITKMQADIALITHWTARAKRENPYILKSWRKVLQRWNIAGPSIPSWGYVDFGYQSSTGGDAFE